MLTSDPSDTSHAAAHDHGAAGYLLKGWAAAAWSRAIRHVAAGGTVWTEVSTQL
jgi:DNA-binding NarL/FixJ family response regulator